MTTSTVNDSRCPTCGKAAGTFMCRGCGKDFYLRHKNEHRQELTKKMDEDVIRLHDQLQQSLDEQTKKPRQDPLMKQVDEWEQLSVEKIYQTADSVRKFCFEYHPRVIGRTILQVLSLLMIFLFVTSSFLYRFLSMRADITEMLYSWDTV
jgi:uncharacterized Zn finger protein (UPF0148 family)